MMININSSIFDLQLAFSISEGCVAVVDDEKKLIGLFGQRENQIVTTQMVDEYDKGIKIENVINKNYSFIVMSETILNDIKEFFTVHSYAYVPIISPEGEFIRFEKNINVEPHQKNNDIRKAIAEKWSRIDQFEDQYKEYRCVICNEEIDTSCAERKTCMCLFGGGKLIRYVCPHCEGISGPLKMLTLTEEELKDDYVQHYSVYQEGDTTEDEIHTFFELNPQKGKKYLNYGCGGDWSKSLRELRERGYDVYGYEPFANSSNVDYVFTEREQINQLKFDGLFSNNLIEHLSNPVEELKFMKQLLHEDAVMAHATGCYEYRYPYTRFHLCFPVGKSARIMFERAGLKIIHRSEVVLHEDKKICILVK